MSTATIEMTPETHPDAVVPVDLARYDLLLRTARYAELVLVMTASHDALASDGTLRRLALDLGLLSRRQVLPEEAGDMPEGMDSIEEFSPPFQAFLAEMNEPEPEEAA